MNRRMIVVIAALVVIGWLGVVAASPRSAIVPLTATNLKGYQLADNDDAEHRNRDDVEHRDKDDAMHHDKDDAMHRDKDEAWDWYQGQRGHWNQDKDDKKWRWQGADNDQWYQGHPGHWYQEKEGWRFATPDLICNNAGRNCRRGGYLATNGEGMVSRRNPKWFWHCDSEGHHCNWAKRPGM